MSLNLEEEVVKIRDVLGAIVSKIPHGTEDEASALAADVAAIGPQPEPEVESADAIQAEIDRRAAATPTKPLSEMTDEELAAELAKRQAEQGQ